MKELNLNLGFNDAKGYGGIAVVEHLAKRSFKHLTLSLSHNEFRDPDAKLMLESFKKLIEKNSEFHL